MCTACLRGLLAPLALMKSADRLPISETRFDAPLALRVLPLPGARPVRHHLPSIFPASEGLAALLELLLAHAPLEAGIGR